MKKKQKLKSLKNLRQFRDNCMSETNENSIIRAIQKRIGQTSNSINISSFMLEARATVHTEFSSYYGYGETESEALKEIVIEMYEESRDYLLTQ